MKVEFGVPLINQPAPDRLVLLVEPVPEPPEQTEQQKSPPPMGLVNPA